MSWPKPVALGLAATLTYTLTASAADFGRPASPDEIKLWDIDVRPDGTGLPNGSGSVAHGRQVYEENCAACHGDRGQGGIADRLAGGQGSLASERPVKTVGSFWPYATTLFDYVRRAMPYPAPQTLSDDDIPRLPENACLLLPNGPIRILPVGWYGPASWTRHLGRT